MKNNKKKAIPLKSSQKPKHLEIKCNFRNYFNLLCEISAIKNKDSTLEVT